MPMEQVHVESVLALKLADYGKLGGPAAAGVGAIGSPSPSGAVGTIAGGLWWRQVVGKLMQVCVYACLCMHTFIMPRIKNQSHIHETLPFPCPLTPPQSMLT